MKIIIDEAQGVYWVTEERNGSVFPTVSYDSPRACASRVLQLLGVGPVAPQTHPETACIGEVNAQRTHLKDGDE